MEDRKELEVKIKNYEEKIKRLQIQIANEDESEVFGRINITELSQEITECESRIERLRTRIAGTQEEIDVEALRRMEYVNSPAYDND